MRALSPPEPPASGQTPDLARRAGSFDELRAKGREAAAQGAAQTALDWFRLAAEVRPDDAETRIDMAEQLYALGQREEARNLFASALQTPPTALDALRGLGRIAMVEDDNALAESCWHLVNRLAPADPWAGHNRATCLLRMGRLDEAERQYRAQLQAFPDFLSSWRGRAQVARQEGRHEAALAHFEKALELAPQHLETHLDCVRQCIVLQWRDDARRHLAAAAALSPNDPRLAELDAAIEAAPYDPLRLGEAALQAGRLDEAFKRLRAASEAAPDDLRARYALALCLMALDRADEAEPLLAELAALDPPHAEALAALARIVAKSRRAEEAIALWLRAADLKPADPWIRNDLGHFAIDHGDLELAEAQFRFILARAPNFFHALRGLARIAKARGDLVGAIAYFERAAEIEPDDPWMPWEIANLEARLGRAGAAERLADLIARHPDFAPAYQELARLRMAAGDGAEAARLLDAASALRPDEAWLRFEAARARRAAGDSDGAVRRLRELAGEGPASAAARLELFHLLRERGEDVEAAEWLRQSLQATPDDPHLIIAEAGRLEAEGRLDDAEALYDDLARRELAPYWRRVGKGGIAKRRGLAAEARRWFEEAIAIEPNEPAAYGELCALATTQAETEDAERRLDAWIAAAPRLIAARMQKARFHSQRAEPEAALAQWRQIAELWPDRPEVFVEMSRAQEHLGDAAAATRSLERAAALDPNHPALLEALARRAEWRDDLDGAQGLMARALKLTPGRRWLRPQLARLQCLAGRFDAALATLDAFSAGAADPELEFQRVDLLRQTGRLPEAAAASRAARARFDGHFRLRWQGACLDVDLGRFDDAALAIETARPVNRFETAGVAFLAGYAAMGQWNFAAARPHLEAAWRANPEDGWALNRLIHCDLLLFDIEATRAHLQALAKLNRSFNQIKGKSIAYSQTHYGQIFDEFRLDAEALEQTRAALEISDEPARLAALRQCVRQYPHYTPAGIAALIACRQAGLLKAGQATGGEATATPARMAQFWDAADLPADLDIYVGSWSKHNPDLAYQRFDAKSAESELAQMGLVEALRAFRRAEQPAMQADIFRLAHLYRHGGVYADADDRCLNALAPLRAGGASLVLYQEDLGSVGNNFLIAAPNHPVIARALDDAVQAVNQGTADLLWLATGPGALTRALAAHLFSDETGWRARLDEVRILDRAEMLDSVAIHCHSGYKSTERHWSRTAFGRPGARPNPRR